jgi:hypothetical protein
LRDLTALASGGIVNEALYLLDNGLSAYDGDVYHQPPLLLYVFALGYNTPYARIIHFIILVLCDLLTAESLRYGSHASYCRLIHLFIHSFIAFQ